MSDDVPSFKHITPGGTIGMVGGGQLGRMFAIAAAQLGYRVVVFCNRDDEPAAQVATATVTGQLDDPIAIERFASQCDVITLEFENIPAETMRRCADHAPVHPSQNVLATTQDRFLEKSCFLNAGLPVTPFEKVQDRQSLLQAGERLGFPMVVKTARDGYDGRGQYRINTANHVDEVDWASADDWITEAFVKFDCEVSVIVTTSATGESAAFPVFRNQHRNHILDLTSLPVNIPASIEKQAQEIAIKAASTLGLVGIMCVEFFVRGEDVMINEVAPRPHNSGHVTIEACHTSQFEQHVRAVCGLPLGDPNMKVHAAAMLNILGDLWSYEDGQTPGEPSWEELLDDSRVSLHLYGKAEPKPARKMGHMTIVGDDLEAIERSLRESFERGRNQPALSSG
ncbi:MAG: 5-(carboxyamino)imidazole ribonucleotide synthase [Planctomycetota bacterium]